MFCNSGRRRRRNGDINVRFGNSDNNDDNNNNNNNSSNSNRRSLNRIENFEKLTLVFFVVGTIIYQ